MNSVGALLMAASLSALLCGTSSAVDWSSPWAEPLDMTAAAQNSDEYAWRLFAALDWPTDPAAHGPDRSVRLGTAGPVVWETWRSAQQVYLAHGEDPGPWVRSGDAERAANEGRRFETASLKDFPNLKRVVDGKMVPVVDPIAAARRLTEIRVNRVAFEYIRERKLYSVEGQIRAVASGEGVAFPSRAIEVKAKWLPIDALESARYHTTAVTLADGTRRLYGLTALHIASKVLSHWFWATFEQVDNPSLHDNEGWQLPSKDTFACPRNAADCNRIPTGIGLEGTVWQNYRLRGTMTRYVDAAGNAQLLANSELESGMQKTASCITCHARAAIAVAGRESVHLSVFDSGTASPDDARVRQGFVGVPRVEWFDNRRSDGHGLIFRPLDFVWSMAKAQHQLQ